MKKRITILVTMALLLFVSCDKEKTARLSVNKAEIIGEYVGQLSYTIHYSNDPSLGLQDETGEETRDFKLVVSDGKDYGSDLKFSYIFPADTVPYYTPQGDTLYNYFTADTSIMYINNFIFEGDYYFNIPLQTLEGEQIKGNKCEMGYDGTYIVSNNILRFCTKTQTASLVHVTTNESYIKQ